MTTQTDKRCTKKTWMKIHTYLSLFFLPFALLYVVTGVGYICDFHHDAGAKIVEVPLESPPKKGEERGIMLDLLAQHNLRIPSNTELKFFRGNANMGSVAYTVSIAKDKEGKPVLRVTDRSLYGTLLLMHKSAGSKLELGGLRFSVFDCFALGFALSLLLFYLSGLIVTSFCKQHRVAGFSMIGLGFVAMIGAIYLSL